MGGAEAQSKTGEKRGGGEKARRRKSVKKEEVADAVGGLRRVDLLPVTHWLSTGCTILDLAIANQLPGGFACGRISRVYGPQSSAKTVLAQEPLGSAQRQGGRAWFDNVEGTLDGDRVGLFGLNVDKRFKLLQSTSIEELFDKHIADALKRREPDSKPGAMSVDSLSALPSETEIKEGLDKTGFGATRPKQLSRAFRKYIRKLSQANFALIFIDQTRDNFNPFEGKYAVSGGRSVGFYASTCVLVERKKLIKNAYGKVIGVTIKFQVTKNKVAPPFREGTFRILFDLGIDNVATNLEWLQENILIEDDVKAGWYDVGDLFGGKKLGPGLAKAITAVEDANLEKELEQRVWEVWREVYRTDERKLRVRE